MNRFYSSLLKYSFTTS